MQNNSIGVFYLHFLLNIPTSLISLKVTQYENINDSTFQVWKIQLFPIYQTPASGNKGNNKNFRKQISLTRQNILTVDISTWNRFQLTVGTYFSWGIFVCVFFISMI